MKERRHCNSVSIMTLHNQIKIVPSPNTDAVTIRFPVTQPLPPKKSCLISETAQKRLKMSTRRSKNNAMLQQSVRVSPGIMQTVSDDWRGVKEMVGKEWRSELALLVNLRYVERQL